MLQIGNILSLIAVVIVNFLSTSLPINNVTPAEVTYSFPHLLIPAGFTFSIWGIIYLWLTAFCIYQASRITNPMLVPASTKADLDTGVGDSHDQHIKADNPIVWVEKTGVFFIVTCMLNISWIFSWHHYQIGLCLAIILVYFIVLLMIYQRTSPNHIHTAREMWLVSAPFSIYTGWLTIALLENFSSWLVSINMAGLGMEQVTWACINIVIAILCALFFRFRFNDHLYPPVVGWALVGIAYRQYHSEELNLVVVSATIGVILTIVVSVIPSGKSVAYQSHPKSA